MHNGVQHQLSMQADSKRVAGKWGGLFLLFLPAPKELEWL